VNETYPETLRYTKEHEWCRLEGDTATIGITWHAQDALGDIVYCELPAVGDEVTIGKAFGVVESVKAVSDLFAPVSGTVSARNDAIASAPEGLNQDPYDKGWMIKVKVKNTQEVAALLDAKAYVAFLKSSEG
jgi:glycine cleavage system H protein